MFLFAQIHNYRGQAIIVVSCVTKDAVPKCKPHPHSLVGRDCKKGVCTVRVKDASVVRYVIVIFFQCGGKEGDDGIAEVLVLVSSEFAWWLYVSLFLSSTLLVSECSQNSDLCLFFLMVMLFQLSVFILQIMLLV